jgi:hypothetical protein
LSTNKNPLQKPTFCYKKAFEQDYTPKTIPQFGIFTT